jgi:bifunctional DNase/RNase
MKKTEVRILGLSYSHNQIGSYILVLSDTESPMKLPIIIKQNEAQFIALKMESIKYTKPTIFDLIKSFCETLGGDVQEVLIHNLVEGVFYTKLIVTNSLDEFEINCSVGDGVAISLVFGCPIMVSDQVMQAAGIQMTDDGVVTEDQRLENHKERKSTISVHDLEKMLEKAIENEEYEIASQLRDRINEIKGL